MNRKGGRCWLFGDDINTDVLAPGQYVKAPIETLANHCLESVNPVFAANVQTNDLLVAGRNFGIGSSREQAAQALLILGIKGVIAQSFGGIFFRNAINLGLPVFVPQDAQQLKQCSDGDRLEFSLEQAVLHNVSNDTLIKLKPLPDFLLQMVRAGGLIKVLEKRFGISER